MSRKKSTKKKPRAKLMPSGKPSQRKPGETRGARPGTKGRPCKLTPDIQQRICDSIAAGNYIEPSAILAGVCKVTLYGWLKKGTAERDRVARAHEAGRPAKVTKDKEKFVSFLNAVKAAEAKAEARDVALIAEASRKQWQAAAWRLERKHYDRWGRKQALEHSGPDGKPVKVQKIVIGDTEIEF